MQYYFNLQFTRIKRWFDAVGLNPLVGVIVSLLLFCLVSFFLFRKTEFASWIYSLLAISTVIKLSDSQRNTQLKLIFNKESRFRVRLIENSLVVIPFLLYLLYEGQIVFSIGLLVITGVLVLIDFRKSTNWILPTPFKRIPFENIAGFRKSILVILLAYFIVIKAIEVDNYNLGVVIFGSIFLIVMSFYAKPEPSYFVWVFADKPVSFLRRKLLDAWICSSVLVTPAFICLLIFFPDRFAISIAVLLVGLVFISSMVLAKYSAFPKEINLPQGILFALSLWFPPMLLFVVPIFYQQSKRSLEKIL